MARRKYVIVDAETYDTLCCLISSALSDVSRCSASYYTEEIRRRLVQAKRMLEEEDDE